MCEVRLLRQACHHLAQHGLADVLGQEAEEDLDGVLLQRRMQRGALGRVLCVSECRGKGKQAGTRV